MENDITLADYIRKLMDKRRISGRQLSDETKVGQGSLYWILNEKGDPNPKTLIRLANYFNIPVETLFRLTGWLPQRAEVLEYDVAELKHLMSQLSDRDREELIALARIKVSHQIQDQEDIKGSSFDEEEIPF